MRRRGEVARECTLTCEDREIRLYRLPSRDWSDSPPAVHVEELVRQVVQNLDQARCTSPIKSRKCYQMEQDEFVILNTYIVPDMNISAI